MLSRLYLLLILMFTLGLVSPANALEQCLAIFPDVEQEFGPQLTLPNFESSDEYIGDLSGSNLALVEGQYKDIVVTGEGLAFFTTLGGAYSITKLDVGEKSTVIFVGGDYFIDTLILGKETTLAVTGSDTVRIYANSISIDEEVHINDANGSLIMVSYGDISAGEKLHFTGVMYAQEELDFGEESVIVGSITADEVDIDSPTSSSYQESSITGADFNGMCDVPSPTPID